MRGLSLLVLLACRPGSDPKDTAPTPPEVPDWTAYDGTFTWTVGGLGAEEPGCELVFAFEGEPADVTCEDCEYAFELRLTWLEDESIDTWRCSYEEMHDITWVLGFDVDFYGYDVGATWMYHEMGAYWTQAFYSELDGDTLRFGYSYYCPAYYYDYYVYSFYGVGTVRD